MSKLHRIHKHYVPRIASQRAHHDVLDWAGADTQAVRFAVLPRLVELDGKSVLDVGCGLGDLAGYLRNKNLHVRYTGVDVLPEMLARARKVQPGERFVLADLFADEPDALAGETFDVVFCSGAFNLNLGNNLEFLAHALPRLWRRAREALVVNFLHTREMHRDPTYFHYDPAEVISILAAHAGRENIRLVDDYLPNDFTLLCRGFPNESDS